MLIPDVVYQPEAILEDALIGVAVNSGTLKSTLSSKSNNSTLNGLKGLIVKVSEIYIKDNRRGLPLSNRDLPADIYPIFLVSNGGSKEPVRFELPGIFNGVKDNSNLPIAKAGLAIHRDLTTVPQYLDIHVLVMRSLKKKRDLAKALNEVLESDEGKSLIDTIGDLSKITNAGIGISVGAASTLLQLFLKYLKGLKDKQLFYSVISLDRQPDHLGIGNSYKLEHEEYGHAMIEVHGVY